MKLILPAPAKINTFLHVVGRRDDGYHLLESVMVLISLADTVELTLREDGKVVLIDPPAGISEENDLACRAARALQAHVGDTRARLGVDIRLTKRIPQGAGLGGGSSDAATTLLGLNRLWRMNLSREVLMQIGLTLGADVPFFVYGRGAIMTGIGDALRTITVPRARLVLAHPRVGLSTLEVFRHPLLDRNQASSANSQFNWTSGINSLQSVAELIAPITQNLVREMTDAGLKPRMTGSGSAYFAPVAENSAVHAALAKLHAQSFDAWVVHSIDRHPLHDFAKSSII